MEEQGDLHDRGREEREVRSQSERVGTRTKGRELPPRRIGKPDDNGVLADGFGTGMRSGMSLVTPGSTTPSGVGARPRRTTSRAAFWISQTSPNESGPLDARAFAPAFATFTRVATVAPMSPAIGSGVTNLAVAGGSSTAA